MNKWDKRVALGAKRMDQIRPGWVDKVDLDTLNQRVATHCVMGQTGGYWSVPMEDRPNSEGFGLDYRDDTTSNWVLLTEAWKRLIIARRNSTAVASEADSGAVEVSQEGLDKALDVIRSIHENTDTYVPELTPQGALMTLLMDLGIRIKVV